MKIYKVLFVLCASWFVFLCFFNYLSPRPLWLDERLILENIENSTAKEILGPLKNSQAFPRIYLILIKIFSRGFNYNIFSLRFFPLLSMLAAFFVWARVYKDGFSAQAYFLLALFSFSSSFHLSRYAAEFKPYSMDVLVVGIFCSYLIFQKRYRDKQPSLLLVATTLLLPFSLFFSYGSFLVFWLVTYNFLPMIKSSGKMLLLAAAYTFMCLLFFSLVYYFDLRHSLNEPGLITYWQDYFVCTDSPYCFFRSFGEGLRKLTVWWFANTDLSRRVASFFIPFFVFSVFGYGIKSLRENKYGLSSINTLGLVVLLELLILGILKKYPFTGERITLFFAPFVFYFIIKGLGFFKKLKPLYFGLFAFYAIFLFGCGLNAFFTYLKLYR